MPKYLKVTLAIIITSIVLPVVLLGTCFATVNTNEFIALPLGILGLICVIIAPIAIIGSIIAIIVCAVKNHKKEKVNNIEGEE